MNQALNKDNNRKIKHKKTKDKKSQSRKSQRIGHDWCWRRLLSPLDCKEIQPVHSKGDKSWVFIGRTNAEAETPILWPPHAKS